MTFEFDYNMETDRITIVYDGSCVLTADHDGEQTVFHNFDKVDDEAVAKVLKNLCREVYGILA